MKRFALFQSASIIIIISSLLIGCSAISAILIKEQRELMYIDNLPENTPKGYVEFYTEVNVDTIEMNNKFTGRVFIIYKLENGEVNKVKGMPWDWQTKRRVAVKPGMHKFAIQFGEAYKYINVQVEEGMIVPVNVTYKLIGKATTSLAHSYGLKSGIKIEQRFTMKVIQEKAFPFHSVNKLNN